MIEAPLLTLRQGALELVVDVAGGGSIRSLRDDGFDVLRAGTGDLRDPTQQASFPLVPFAGRVNQGRFSFEGRDYHLPINFAPEPHAIHGDGWMATWTVVRQTEDQADLVFHHEHRWAVFRYRAWQRFVLEDGVLTAEIGVRNTGNWAMPFGLGHHPYLDRRPGTTIQADVEAIWLTDQLKISTERTPVPDWADFRQERPVEEMVLDHIFAGLKGPATVRWPNEGRGVRIFGDEVLGHLIVYIPPGEDHFCVEPISHAGNAVNMPERTDTGIRVLQPGEEFSGKMRVQPFTLR
jgi:aldose 1-epimerase